MSKAIRFTKAEMEAVEEAEIHLDGNWETEKCHKALVSLLKKMRAASLPSAPAPSLPISSDAASTGGAVPDGPSAAAFSRSFDAVFPGGAIWPDTPKNWRMMNDLVVKHPTLSSVDAAQDLARCIKSWAKRPVNWRTLLDRGGEWLRKERMTAQQAAPAMFHLPQEDDE